MADYIPVPNTAEVLVGATIDGQAVNSVHNFEFPTELDVSILDDLATSVIARWAATLASSLSEDIILNFVKATDLTTAFSPTVTKFPTTETKGLIEAPTVPLNVAICISHRTPLRGRSYRGRTYQGGLVQTGVENPGEITEVYQGQLLNAFEDYIDFIETDNDCDYVIVSRQNNNAPREVGQTTPVSSNSIDTNFDSSRRRLVGRGT